MTDLQTLLAQREALNEQIANVRKQERAAVIASMREQIAAFDLLPHELFGKNSSQKGSKVPAKYYDPDSGKSWSGRGKAPRWLDGKNLAEFLIEKPGLIGAMEKVA